jgi:hypothetical protein
MIKKVLGSEFKVLGSGFSVQGYRFWVLGSGFRVIGSGFWVEKNNPQKSERQNRRMSKVKG